MHRTAFSLSFLLVIVGGCGSSSGNKGDATGRPGEIAGSPDAVPVDSSGEEILETDRFADAGDDAGPYSGFAPSGRKIRNMLGVSTHMSRSVEYSWKREVELDRLEELGFTQVRSDFYWNSIEPEDGNYDVSGPAHMTGLCLERGLEVLGILLIPPEWAQVDGTYDSVDPERWRLFVQYTVGEMKDRIHKWEVWNEPNLDVFWSPKPNPANFGLFLKIAAEEIRDQDPDAEVLFGGLSPFGFHPESVWGFLSDVHKFHPDVCDAFDSLAIHPYSFAQQDPPEDTFSAGEYVHPPMGGLIDEARTVLAKVGCPDRAVHLTEAGWPHYYMGVEKQAAFGARGLLLATAAGAESWYWYTTWDSVIGPDQPAPTEDTFGLLTPPESMDSPGERKPSFYAMKGISQLLGESRYAGDLGAVSGWSADHHALAFVSDEGCTTVAVWHSLDDLDTEVALEVPLPPGATTWNRFDQQAEWVEEGITNPVAVMATGHVTYLAFECPTP